MLSSYEPRIIFTRKMLFAIHKDVLLSTQQSAVVYQYVCQCDCRYVGPLNNGQNQLACSKAIRNQSMPTKILPKRSCKTTTSTSPQCDSAIGLHLLQNDNCAKFYNNDQFSILAKGRSQFCLATLEATYIKLQQPILCRHKEFVYTLQITH